MRQFIDTRSTRFDVSASAEEEYVEEIGMTMFIQSMLIGPSLEPRAIAPSHRTPEVTLAVEAAGKPLAAAIDKGKGAFVSPLKKMRPARPK